MVVIHHFLNLYSFGIYFLLCLLVCLFVYLFIFAKNSSNSVSDAAPVFDVSDADIDSNTDINLPVAIPVVSTSSADINLSIAIPVVSASGVAHVVSAAIYPHEGNNTINSKDNTGKTALMWACINGHYSIALKLIKAGANINDKDSDLGRSPLIYACINNNLELVKLLLFNSANINQKDYWGLDALAHVLPYEYGLEEMVNILKRWEVTMAMIVLKELGVLSGIDPISFLDIPKFM